MLHNLFSLTLVAVLALLSSVLADPGPNLPTLVSLRIEGSTNTIFEGPIVTRGHDVTTPSGGTHKCDGTNFNANFFPGPTCTSALDDGSKLNAFTFDGYVSYYFFHFFTMANFVARNVNIIVHFLTNLMISSSLPSTRRVRHRKNLGVYSSISTSFKLGVANNKSNPVTRFYLHSMPLMQFIS